MVYFAIDTETTGLPKTRAKPTLSNIDKYDECRMLSFALVEFSSDHKEVSSYHMLMYPSDFEVKCTEIHGITEEDAKKNGKHFEDFYLLLTTLIHYSVDDCVFVGHNLQFDMNVIRSEFIRHNKALDILDKVTEICTLKLYRQVFMKPIKLTALYKDIFNRELDGAHNALNDARGAGEVYPYLIKDIRKYFPIKKKRVVIKASEVAACIGANSYKPAYEVLCDMWKKNNPNNFDGVTKEEKYEMVTNSSEEAKALFDTMSKQIPSDSDGVNKLVEKSVSAIQNIDDLDTNEKSMVTEHIRKMIYTNHGTRSEDKTADLDENKLITDDTFYSLAVITIQGTTYEIVGRIDRLQLNDDGSKTLVEIKNRTRGLFKKVRDYENIQVQTYLQMIKLQRARLVEQHNNERLSYNIEIDHKMWNDLIFPKLQNFCKTLHYYMSN
jgi:DNA polymerase III epsilon subunit-like protein